jgi:hypothetical protein
MPYLLPIHLAVTAIMTGIIWFVQVIHYPWFHEVPAEKFRAYHQRYTDRMGRLVGPIMLIELVTGVMLAWMLGGALMIANLVGIIALWLSTFFLQVPCHNRLSAGYDADIHRRLVTSNWIRTVIWTARLLLLIGAA